MRHAVVVLVFVEKNVAVFVYRAVGKPFEFVLLGRQGLQGLFFSLLKQLPATVGTILKR